MVTVSWVRLVTLLCDADQCTARYRSQATDLVAARLDAQYRGWTQINGLAAANSDLCPHHTEGGTP